jgi:hypothetical protein
MTLSPSVGLADEYLARADRETARDPCVSRALQGFQAADAMWTHDVLHGRQASVRRA